MFKIFVPICLKYFGTPLAKPYLILWSPMYHGDPYVLVYYSLSSLISADFLSNWMFQMCFLYHFVCLDRKYQCIFLDEIYFKEYSPIYMLFLRSIQAVNETRPSFLLQYVVWGIKTILIFLSLYPSLRRGLKKLRSH